MLNFGVQRYRLCDGLTRREVLRAGALGMGGLTLGQLLAAESAAGVRNSRKSIIMVYMCGAPSHLDMYDLKPSAPAEIRGEFEPIDTNVAGIRICEHLPQMARIADKLAFINSMYGSPNGAHDSYICYTGRPKLQEPPGGWPAIGPVTARLLGAAADAVPPFIGLSPNTGHPPYGSPGLPGFLGPAYAAFRPSGPARDDMYLRDMPPARLDDRKRLLATFDNLRREIDASGTMDAVDTFQRQALEILTSGRLAEALDISREPDEVRERYGQGDPKNFGDGAPRNLEHFLLARRLVEAGARVVTLNFGRWDFHSNNFPGMKNTHLPPFDQGLSALVEDLHARGLDKDVAVVAWGEFGRTPRINADGGRDHWPKVGNAVVAGGGFRTGQVIGATDRLAADITDRPVHFGEVMATLYRHLGIDFDSVTLTDLAGRPQYLVDNHRPVAELVS